MGKQHLLVGFDRSRLWDGIRSRVDTVRHVPTMRVEEGGAAEDCCDEPEQHVDVDYMSIRID